MTPGRPIQSKASDVRVYQGASSYSKDNYIPTILPIEPFCGTIFSIMPSPVPDQSGSEIQQPKLTPYDDDEDTNISSSAPTDYPPESQHSADDTEGSSDAQDVDDVPRHGRPSTTTHTARSARNEVNETNVSSDEPITLIYQGTMTIPHSVDPGNTVNSMYMIRSTFPSHQNTPEAQKRWMEEELPELVATASAPGGSSAGEFVPLPLPKHRKRER